VLSQKGRTHGARGETKLQFVSIHRVYVIRDWEVSKYKSRLRTGVEEDRSKLTPGSAAYSSFEASHFLNLFGKFESTLSGLT